MARVAVALAIAGGCLVLFRTVRDERTGVARPTCAFLGVLFLVKAWVEFVPPGKFIRRDFLWPLWALWRPATAWWWFLPPLGLLVAGVLVWHRACSGEDESAPNRRFRPPAWIWLPGLMLVATVLWICLALTNDGYPEGLTEPFRRDADYFVPVGRFDSMAEVWSRYTERQEGLSIHARTHPPGAVALLHLFSRVTGGSLPAVSLLVVLTGALTLLPLYGWARACLPEDRHLPACLLWTLTPSVSLYGATAMDMVFSLPLVTASALFFTAAADQPQPGARRRGVLPAGLLLGIALAVSSVLTFSVLLLIAVLAGVAGLSLARGRRDRVRPALVLLVALVVGGTLLLTLRPIAGFDWLECLRIARRLDATEWVHFTSPLHHLHGRLTGLFDFLVMAGVAAAPTAVRIAAIGLASEASRDRSLLEGMRVAGLVAILFLLLGAYKVGETGRIWMFLLPFLILPICRDRPRLAVGAILLADFLQVLLMEALLDTRW